MNKFLLALPLVLAACGSQVPRPACDKWPDDCTSGVVVPDVSPPVSSRPDVPAFDFTPTLPQPMPSPEVPVVDPELEVEDRKDKGPKGNASANNDKGGNYGRTGHEDNGKGQGRFK